MVRSGLGYASSRAGESHLTERIGVNGHRDKRVGGIKPGGGVDEATDGLEREGSSLHAASSQCATGGSNLRTEVKETRLRATPCGTLELTLRRIRKELQGSRCAATITGPTADIMHRFGISRLVGSAQCNAMHRATLTYTIQNQNLNCISPKLPGRPQQRDNHRVPNRRIQHGLGEFPPNLPCLVSTLSSLSNVGLHIHTTK